MAAKFPIVALWRLATRTPQQKHISYEQCAIATWSAFSMAISPPLPKAPRPRQNYQFTLAWLALKFAIKYCFLKHNICGQNFF
jgi:hypothetical protein